MGLVVARINNRSKLLQAFKTWPSILAITSIVSGTLLLPLLSFNWLLIAIIVLTLISLGLYIYFYTIS